jgi:hypothetical protein
VLFEQPLEERGEVGSVADIAALDGRGVERGDSRKGRLFPLFPGDGDELSSSLGLVLWRLRNVSIFFTYHAKQQNEANEARMGVGLVGFRWICPNQAR